LGEKNTKLGQNQKKNSEKFPGRGGGNWGIGNESRKMGGEKKMEGIIPRLTKKQLFQKFRERDRGRSKKNGGKKNSGGGDIPQGTETVLLVGSKEKKSGGGHKWGRGGKKIRKVTKTKTGVQLLTRRKEKKWLHCGGGKGKVLKRG